MLAVNLDTSSGTPVFKQLYEQIRNGILAGRLRSGTRLPASRTLAADLGISRTTVINALDQLRAEGYIRGRVGSGTRVMPMLPETTMRIGLSADEIRRSVPSDGQPMRRIQGRWPDSTAWTTSAARPLRPGNPDLNGFPRDLWAKLAAKYWRTVDPVVLGYSDPKGYLPLRAAIPEYLSRVRGVRCDVKQVLIVAGSQQALHLCAQVVLKRGDIAWMEDPGYPGARAALIAAGARIVPKRVDAEGLVLPARNDVARPKLIYVTPSHQCPLGVAMSVSRRLQLIEFAAKNHAWIIEDDYYSEYRYFSRPIAALQSLDRGGRVIYIGSVSKTLVPALRIGYIIAPSPLVDVFVRARQTADRQSGTIDQAVLAELLTEGWLERHIRQTRIRYLERQRALLDAIRTEMPDILEAAPSEAGMYLVAYIKKKGLTSSRAARWAAAHGVDVMPLSAFSIRPLAREGLVLGYGEFSVEEIRNAVRKLSRAFRDM